MNIIKDNIKFVIVIIICLIGSSITTLATNYLFNSNEVSYDNTNSGLHADYVQGAIDEVFQHATDYSEIKSKIGSSTLTTTSNTLIGAINELNSNSGVTAGSYGPSANATPTYGATFDVPYITVDAKGRVTSASTKTIQIPDSDKVTVTNNLTSTSTTNALSAAQGKALKSNIDSLFKTIFVSGKIIDSGTLSANSYGYITVAYTIPSGYKTLGGMTISLNHPGVAGGLSLLGSPGRGETGENSLYLSYYTPRSIGAAQTDFTLVMPCIKIDSNINP